MFKIRVNSGPAQDLNVRTGIYRDAAAAVPAILGISTPIDVEIWVEELVSDYPALHYRVSENEFGGLIIDHLIQRS